MFEGPDELLEGVGRSYSWCEIQTCGRDLVDVVSKSRELITGNVFMKLSRCFCCWAKSRQNGLLSAGLVEET